jgi:large subunit ribosomal protein MRP49
MVNIPQRVRKLQRSLADIRLGPGAMILPKDVQRIEMRFATRINGGHMGPR